MKRIIIDCDAGVDDALALILAFHSPELNVVGVTGVNGNVSVDKVMVNIKKVLSLIALPRRPLIARGADRPLRGDPVYAEAFHGEDGLGGAKIDAGEGGEYWETYGGPAEELIPEMARRHPGEITLIAIGPLTNIALALQRDSDGMRRLKEVVVMGGAPCGRREISPLPLNSISSSTLSQPESSWNPGSRPRSCPSTRRTGSR